MRRKTFGLSLLLLLVANLMWSQEHVNTKKGVAASGYDVVAYFDDEALKGKKEFTATYMDVTYRFASEANLSRFNENPDEFVPQYGGYCAYAIAEKSEKVGINPKTYQIQDGKLYLFYNSWGVNTLDKWNEAGAMNLQKKADTNWKRITN